jgi:hypothetical protein
MLSDSGAGKEEGGWVKPETPWDRVTDAFFSSEWDTAASSRTSLSFLAAHYKNLRIARNDKRVAKKGSMSETQFFVVLIVAVMAVALLATALTGMFEIERVFEVLPLFEDLIGD